jgi:hypothetical protein
MSREMDHKVIVPKKIMSQSFLNSGTLVILCTRVLLLCVRGVGRSPWPGFKSRPTQLSVTGSEDSVMMSSSPSQGQKRWWYSGENRIESWVWVTFKVRWYKDRVLSWVRLGLGLWLFATASIQILVRNVIHYCAADFSLLNLPKGKSLGHSKPATNS